MTGDAHLGLRTVSPLVASTLTVFPTIAAKIEDEVN